MNSGRFSRLEFHPKQRPAGCNPQCFSAKITPHESWPRRDPFKSTLKSDMAEPARILPVDTSSESYGAEQIKVLRGRVSRVDGRRGKPLFKRFASYE